MSPNSVAQSDLIELFRRRLSEVCRKAGRPTDQIRCVAISKGQPAESIRAAAAAGFKEIGENRIQEALKKSSNLGDLGIVWHLVGTLQTNKVRSAVNLFSMIQSLDRKELAEAIQKECEKQNRQIDVLIQVEPTGEPGKHGVRPEEIVKMLKALRSYDRLRIRGLMAIGPNTEDSNAVHSCFRNVRRLFTEIQKADGLSDYFDTLSMGMSSDFEIAIEEGATMIRVGTLIFGSRPVRRANP